jgi:hypothetical protein
MFESGGLASCEFYSVNLATGERTLINDITQPNAIRSYRSIGVAMPPRITSVVRNGSNLEIQWIDGTPPFQVQASDTMRTGGWNNSGAPTPNRSAIVPIQGVAGFFRVTGQ